MNDEMQGQNHAAYLWPDGLHYTEPPDSTTEAFQNWIRDVVAERDEWKAASKDGLKLCEQYRAELAEARAQLDRLREAVSWFMGISGDFPAREAGDPPYWFRAHFHTRFADICTALQEANDD